MNKTLYPAHLSPAHIKATIGLISDTHMPQRCAALPATLAEVFAGVDLILHAGDVGELWVLDQLSAIAPVIAVHGNDDTVAAQRELPYQQVLTIAGQRILLWHSHFPDRIDEMDSRRDDDLPPKFARSIERAQRCGAQTVVFGHWHIPLVYAERGIRLINPGALASGNPITRQLRQTVALLFVCDDGTSAVSHVDLAAPNVIYKPPVDLSLGFNAISQEFSASILAPELAARQSQLMQQFYTLGAEVTLPPLLRVAQRCWAGEQPSITLADLLAEARNDPDLGPRRKAQYEALLQQFA
jgi:putative phosphoesterase